LYHHIGLYAYRRAALERFVTLPPSPLERRERLEQLRALGAGMRIDVAIVASVPLRGETPPELEKARTLLSASQGGSRYEHPCIGHCVGCGNDDPGARGAHVGLMHGARVDG